MGGPWSACQVLRNANVPCHNSPCPLSPLRICCMSNSGYNQCGVTYLIVMSLGFKLHVDFLKSHCPHYMSNLTDKGQTLALKRKQTCPGRRLDLSLPGRVISDLQNVPV